MARRVLILTYYFPPSGGAGVQRILKTVKYLPDVEWTPVVLTVREGAYPARDASLWADVPADAEVHRTASWNPYRLYARLTGQSAADAVVQGSTRGAGEGWMTRLARWVRANLFLPDARVGWVPFAVRRGHQLLADKNIDAVLTTGPPHSTHLAGAALRRWTGVPWVADFRDPWTDINYYEELPHTRWARRLDAALERLVLRHADAVTTVSPSWRDRLAAKGVENEAETFHVVQNGYDDADVTPAPQAVDETTFALTHVGSLYASRNPEGLWRALRTLRQSGAIPKARIRLVGTVDPNVKRSLGRYGLEEIADFIPYVPHDEAVTYMQRAGLLLLSIEAFPAAGGMLTGKIYEYLASGRPVVGVGPAGGDAAALLRKTDGGRLFARADAEGLASYIQGHYEAWAAGRPQTGASSEAIRLYRRRNQTRRMADVLDAVAL